MTAASEAAAQRVIAVLAVLLRICVLRAGRLSFGRRQVITGFRLCPDATAPMCDAPLIWMNDIIS